MSLIDILLIVLVLAAAVFAVRSVLRRRKNGGCSCGCSGCASSCPSRKNSNSE